MLETRGYNSAPRDSRHIEGVWGGTGMSRTPNEFILQSLDGCNRNIGELEYKLRGIEVDYRWLWSSL